MGSQRQCAGSGAVKSMMSRSEPSPALHEHIGECDRVTSDISCIHDRTPCGWGPRIALLTPYNGGNLGDAAIQDAMIHNLRCRLPGAEFSGVTLNCDNFVQRHGGGSFPLCARETPFYSMSQGTIEDSAENRESSAGKPSRKSFNASSIKNALKRVPLLGKCFTFIYTRARGAWREVRHCVEGYRFLRTQDLLIVSGGGQIDDEWGGAWGHPFALFKWAVLARMARVPYAIASVGAGKVSAKTSRVLLYAALRLSRYRSYRDKNSRSIAAHLLPRAAADPVVPDLAFSLLSSMLPNPRNIRFIAKDRPVVAISPIAYAKPKNWPSENLPLYDSYLRRMAKVMSALIDGGYFIVVVWSSLGDDDSVIPDLLERVDGKSRLKLAEQILIPPISTWQDFAATLQCVDVLIASRLHSAILGFVTHTPTVAISFDPKVDWVMEDLGKTDCLMHISDFTPEDVIAAVARIKRRGDVAFEQTAWYQDGVHSAYTLQYNVLADLALASHRRFS